jgi:ABC-2 type transport system ATP-binding protein
MDEAEALSDNLVIINRGKAVAAGTPRTVKAAVTQRSTRIDIYDKFTQSELGRFGRVTSIAGRYRVLADEQGARSLGEEAVARGATISMSPVTLDDVFVDIVGEAEKEEENEQ